MMGTADQTAGGDFDIAEMLFERLQTDGQLVRSGYQAAELRIHPALRNLAACYRKAQKDDQARIPSYLEAAIRNVTAILPQSAPRADWERDQSGRGDMSPRGGELKPGS